ncbi:MAG: hypothetical protein DLM50_00870 [Candidatus Meridianibacter frigidus]|nr:MAG: hypothetical protein DLM50_00870 [Candidatus Eremiobacteraeota bacterium]
MILTFEEARKATEAHVEHAERAPAEVIVSTDTRTLQPGQTYLALRGERFNGHRYVGEALRQGAAALVIDEEPPQPVAVSTLIVRDTLRAYLDLARAARAKFRGQVIAITGSTGKTTTKTFLARLLSSKFGDAVVAAPANENNEVGVGRLLLEVRPETRALVVEMGARHYRDVEVLVDAARPQVGVLTNIGEAHLEIFGSRERLIETKWGLFSGGARAVLSVHDETSVSRAPSLTQPPIWFGLGDPAASGRSPVDGGAFLIDRQTLGIVRDGKSERFPTHARIPGDYNLLNLAAALAAALDVGCAPSTLAQIVPQLELPPGRYERVKVRSSVCVVYDAYNASLTGTMATLDAFAQEPASRRIAVLGSMAELGDEAESMHERVGAHAAARRIDIVLAGGEYAQALSHGALAAGATPPEVIPFASNAEALKWLETNLHPGDAVLIKGSRKYAMEQILDGLRA